MNTHEVVTEMRRRMAAEFARHIREGQSEAYAFDRICTQVSGAYFLANVLDDTELATAMVDLYEEYFVLFHETVGH